MHVFNGLLVVELASVLAGPGVGQFFAELGARVLKVENAATAGDVTRKWKLSSEDPASDLSAYFASVNWGKESVLADLKTAEGLALVQRLARKADIVIASYKPGDAQKLGVDYASLAALNPRLLYGQITGYGPDVARAGYDAVLQAETGFMYLNGQPEGPPTKMPVALIDILAGHQLKEALLAALWMRERTGKGQLVEVSLQHAAVASLANQAANLLVAGHNPQRMGSEHPNIAPYGSIFSTKDEKQLVLAIGDDRQFSALCEVLGRADLARDARFLTNSQRVRHREALNARLQELILLQPLSPLLEALISRHVPAGAVNDLQTVFNDPAVAGLVLRAPRDAAAAAGLRTVAFRMSGLPEPVSLSPPPHLGAHTAQVEQEFIGEGQ